MNLCSITTSKYPHNLMNRCKRGPYVQWCERRTSSLRSSEAIYSIVHTFKFALQIVSIRFISYFF